MSSRNETHIDTDPVEDYLEVDDPIPGQNFVCLSFVSPEKILKRKELYFCKKFLKYYLKQLRNDSNPEKLDPEKFTPEFVDRLNIEDMYEDFLYSNEDALNDEFSKQNNFQTCIRGLKIRGCYDTRQQAEIRSKRLQQKDPNFHVFIGQVGYWLPWDPNPDNVAEQEYMNDQLNTMVKKYNENRMDRDEHYAQETAERKRRAREENRRRDYYRKKTEEEEREAEMNIQTMRKYADDKDRIVEDMKSAEGEAGGQGQGQGQAEVQDKLFDADPWMKKKMEEGKSFVSGEAKDGEELSSEEKNKNINTIMQGVFS